jgi:hypothetical protein
MVIRFIRIEERINGTENHSHWFRSGRTKFDREMVRARASSTPRISEGAMAVAEDPFDHHGIERDDVAFNILWDLAGQTWNRILSPMGYSGQP